MMVVCPRGHWHFRGVPCWPCADEDLRSFPDFEEADTIPDGHPAFGTFVVRHKPNCLNRPRNPHNCNCGRDHQ